MKRTLWLTIPALLAVLCGCTQNVPSGSRLAEDVVGQLDSTIEAAMEAMGLPGAVVAVWIPGRGDYVAVKGVANIETGTRRAAGDVFRIGSITKAFVATAALLLVERGKLDLGDPVSQYFPDFPNAEDITVGDLVCMRSGIPDAVDEELLALLYQNPLTRLSPQELIARSASWPERFEKPGLKVQYCNTNYVLLGEILRQVTGREVDQIVHDLVVGPLGLKRTAYPAGSTLPGELHGYGWDSERKAFDDLTTLNPRWAGAAGAMTSDIHDLRVFARAIYEGALLKPTTQSLRLEANPLDGMPDWIAYGQGIVRLGDFWGHNGTIFGFSTEMWYLPHDDAVVVISVNRLDLDDQSYAFPLFVEVTRILFPDHVAW
jgi:D-alanyl-D-alanine carboxypeptidase